MKYLSEQSLGSEWPPSTGLLYTLFALVESRAVGILDWFCAGVWEINFGEQG